MTNEARVARDYDRWMRRRNLSARIYAFYASAPGAVLVNTPAFRLPTELQLRPGQRLLDVGCGRGSLLRVLAARVPFEHAPVGVDISGAMLELGHRDHRKGDAAVELVQGSATVLPLADETFDVVTCAYVAKHLRDVELMKLLQEVRRVLTPGGISLVWEFSPTRSQRLDAFHRWLLTRGTEVCHLRNYTQLSALSISAGFEWVGNANLRPFLFPPIPRVSLILGKAPPEWLND
jgi:ubiquinone/menaquinone biosynthesis C-methylase UbiE